MSPITTHVLDTSRGRPAAGVPVTLERRIDGGPWEAIGRGATDRDGRVRDLMPEGLAPGLYRLTFETRPYFDAAGVPAFYPEVTIVFEVSAGEEHYHVPLLISPFGFTTYRGS